MTDHTQKVLSGLLGRELNGERAPQALSNGVYGLELSRLTGLPNGTLFPILERLVQAGWVERYWEADGPAEAEGRPRRRFYKLTAKGAERAPLAIAEATANAPRSASPRALRPRAAGGEQ